MTTSRPPVPVPQEPADPTARARLELPILFQPHVDLEKTSGGGASTEQTTASPNANGVSQSQDSESAGFEAINAEEPFRGYSFEVRDITSTRRFVALCWLPSGDHFIPSLPFLRVLFIHGVTTLPPGTVLPSPDPV